VIVVIDVRSENVILTIEIKMIALWILMWIALVIHHFMIRDMIKEAKKDK